MVLDIKIQFGPMPRALEPAVTRRIFATESQRAINEANTIVKPGMIAVSPFGGTNALRRSWQITPARIEGQKVIGDTRSTGPGSVAALVLEDGAQPHFPPVGDTGEPALSTWIRRALPGVVDPFVIEKGERRPADLNNPEDVRKIAFSIGRAINRRGLPRPGRPTKIYSKAYKKLTPAIIRTMNRMGPRVQRRFEQGR